MHVDLGSVLRSGARVLKCVVGEGGLWKGVSAWALFLFSVAMLSLFSASVWGQAREAPLLEAPLLENPVPEISLDGAEGELLLLMSVFAGLLSEDVSSLEIPVGGLILERDPECLKKAKALDLWLNQHLSELEALMPKLRRSVGGLSGEKKSQLDAEFSAHAEVISEHVARCADHGETRRVFARFSRLSLGPEGD